MNYIRIELSRDPADVSYSEIAVFVKTFLRAMTLGAALAYSLHSREFRAKMFMMGYGAVVMVLTSDMKWSKSELPNPDGIKGKATGSKRIIFIRHGESLWNEAFNGSKMPHKFLYQTAKALVGEFVLLPEADSVLIDSPLNHLGFSQAKQLARAIGQYPRGRQHDQSPQLDRDVAALRGQVSSLITCSNLRRAAQTAVVALWQRLEPTPAARSKESDDDEEGGKVHGKVHGKVGGFSDIVKVLSCLQEVSRNVDAMALTPASRPVELQGAGSSVRDSLGLEGDLDVDELFDSSSNTGNKRLLGTGLVRLNAFCDFALNQQEEVIIVAGHSLWFKHFFNTYLPRGKIDSGPAVDAKDCKMKNGGCVAFTLERGSVNGSYVYRADPDSFTVVEGGFDNKKKYLKAMKEKAKKNQ
eukprot:CAMPEP_0172594794 /NCGR_PEP_ID=MMETSP1068-20121228/14282_1 /TAXON_ID=35684 /ORGANISM="Pseudopedinella elastica, Strain CCMP716" /LENGTH=411 /DNA_ID=CAMNT_0013393023 /DNA_START=33 /DNA_END=1271 /DNA_ORIENTATION=-